MLTKRSATLALAVMIEALLLTGYAASAAGLTETWRAVWTDFSRTYSYFQHKGIDWDRIWTAHENDFETISDATEFAIKLDDILQVLRDWHVFVGKPDGQRLGFRGEAIPNYHPSKIVFTRYTGGVSYENLKSASAIGHARLEGGIGHIVVLTFGDRFTQNITDQDLEQLYLKYRDAPALILDMRANTGGDENHARRMVSFLTDVPRIYGYTRTRIAGEDRGAFTGFAPRQVSSRGEPLFRGPIVGLIGQRTMSSGEGFALMIRALPNGILMGDTTRGATANPVIRTIDTLGVTYSVSTWIGYDTNRVAYEGVGIAPDIRVAATASYDEERDYVLERAIEHVRSAAEPFGIPSAWIREHQITIGERSDADGDGFFDRHEWAAGTHPRDATSLLRIASVRPADAGAGLIIRWSSVAGKRYQLHRAKQLLPEAFQPIGEILNATSIETETTDPGAIGSGPWLYRIELLNN